MSIEDASNLNIIVAGARNGEPWNGRQLPD
jgi:hypothetical protein